MSERVNNDRIYKELLHDWLCSNRREALLLGAGAFASLLGMFDQAYADAEFPIDASAPSNSKSGAANVEAPQSNSSPPAPSVREQIEPRGEDKTDIEDQLGSAFRAPMCGLQNLTTSQYRATGTPEKIPENRSVTPGSFFSDNASRRFLSAGESALDTAWRATAITNANLEGSKRAANQQNDVGPLPASQTRSTAATNMAKLLNSVEWSELGHAIVEKPIDIAADFAKGKAMERALTILAGARMATAYGVVSTAIDAITPTPMNRGNTGPELTFMDRLSPSERREFFEEVFREDWRESPFPKEMIPDEPTLHSPY